MRTRTLAALALVALSSTLHADWKTGAEAPYHHAYADGDLSLVVSLNTKDSCSNFSLLVAFDSTKKLTAGTTQVDRASVLTVDGKVIQTWTNATYVVTERRAGHHTAGFYLPLSLEAVIALGGGRSTKIVHGDAVVSWDLKGSKQALNTIAIECLKALGDPVDPDTKILSF